MALLPTSRLICFNTVYLNVQHFEWAPSSASANAGIMALGETAVAEGSTHMQAAATATTTLTTAKQYPHLLIFEHTRHHG